ncbi:unnamed protein product [Linum trigynum]|uniref:Uncharacterized protein n=1 Tax=Linum trigynum TaxID=586398 RepID=A0AAV2GR95_9ROSI
MCRWTPYPITCQGGGTCLVAAGGERASISEGERLDAGLLVSVRGNDASPSGEGIDATGDEGVGGIIVRAVNFSTIGVTASAVLGVGLQMSRATREQLEAQIEKNSFET